MVDEVREGAKARAHPRFTVGLLLAHGSALAWRARAHSSRIIHEHTAARARVSLSLGRYLAVDPSVAGMSGQ